MDLVSFTFVLLRRGPRADEYGEQELDRLQAAHLAHLETLTEQGARLVGGPFDRQPDETLRGCSLFRTPLEETRALVDADPSIEAGRLQADVFTWWTERGAIAFPRAAALRDRAGGPSMDLVPHTFVLLRRGDRAAEYAGEELDRLQAAHLAHLSAMGARGAMLVAGPFGDQPDETLRGFCLYRTGREDTRPLVDADPSIEAGRIQADVFTWYTRPGAVEFPAARAV